MVHKKMKNQEKSKKRKEFLFLLILFFASLFFRLFYQHRYTAEVGLDFSLLKELDTHTFNTWGQRISQGDWLCRNMYHPYHWWTKDIGSREVWEGWYGKSTFHQSPLYPYLIGIVYFLTGENPGHVFAFQAVLGSINVLLIYLFCRSLLRRKAAVFSSILCAFLVPAFFYEEFLLRENLLLFLTTLLLLLSVSAMQRGGFFRWALTGGVLGLHILGKPNVAIFLPFLLLGILWMGKSRTLHASAFFSALLLVFSPLLARNLIVGAKPFSITTRGPSAFINGNSCDAPGAGWRPPPSTREILYRSQYRMKAVIWETLKTHQNVWSFFRLQWKKFKALFNGYEYPNNVDFYQLREVFPFLKLPLPNYHLVFALGLTGMILGLKKWRSLFLVYSFFFSYVFSIQLFFFVARFRLPLLPPLMAFCGLAFVAILRFIQKRMLLKGVLSFACFIGLLVITWPSGFFPSAAFAKVEIAEKLLQANSINRAEKLFEEALVEYSADQCDQSTLARIHFGLGKIYFRKEEYEKSIEKFQFTMQHYPYKDILWQGNLEIGSIYFKFNRLDEAQVHFQKAIKCDPEKAEPHYCLGNLFAKKGQFSQSLECLKQSLARDPDLFEAIFLMGYLEEIYLKNPLQAKKYFQKALEINPQHQGVLSRLRNL